MEKGAWTNWAFFVPMTHTAELQKWCELYHWKNNLFGFDLKIKYLLFYWKEQLKKDYFPSYNDKKLESVCHCLLFFRFFLTKALPISHWLILQQACGWSTELLTLLGCLSSHVLFHSLMGFLFALPSQCYFAIGHSWLFSFAISNCLIIAQKHN